MYTFHNNEHRLYIQLLQNQSFSHISNIATTVNNDNEKFGKNFNNAEYYEMNKFYIENNSDKGIYDIQDNTKQLTFFSVIKQIMHTNEP